MEIQLKPIYMIECCRELHMHEEEALQQCHSFNVGDINARQLAEQKVGDHTNRPALAAE